MATTVDEFGNIIEVPTAAEQTVQQNNAYIAGGGADEDLGNQNTDISSPTKYLLNDGAPSPSTELPPNAGTTTAGASSTASAKSAKTRPGRRLKNPLGDFASYTYQLTLYMITPDAYNSFVKSGRRRINAINEGTGLSAAANATATNSGAFVVAQSGGINPSTTARAPGMKLDYYIDDLKIKTVVGTKESETATNTIGMTFNIIEPYGFSFISKLRDATNTLQKVSTSKNYSKVINPSRQFFVLGVRFQGYDINGKPMTGKEFQSGDSFDPSGNSDGVFERFWDINIHTMKFKIEGKATVYNITASATSPGVAFGAKRGILDRGAKIVANTVNEALVGDDAANGVIGLLTKLNNDQKELEKNGSISPGMATIYSLSYLGDAKVQIGNQTIVSKADLDKAKWPMGKAKTTIDSNDALSESAVPNSNKRQITFRNGTPILQAIGLIIAQSSYLEKALKSVYTSKLEPDKQNSEDELINAQTKTLRWYNLSSQVVVKGWDPKTSDFAYDITFIIQPYETPIVMTPTVGNVRKYYGPSKRYKYWYTGENSEIISYEHVSDNTYTNVVVSQLDREKYQGGGGSAQVPTMPGKQSDQPRQGKPVPAMETQNSFLTSLYDPGSWSKAKVTILGDPDLLMSESAVAEANESYVYDQFYGTDGYTINPNGGQVFIEIDFKEAVDYNHQTGLMSINESILMHQYPPSIAREIEGVSYMLQHVISSFTKGKFIQELSCTVNTFENVPTDDASGLLGREAKSTSNAPNQTGTGTSGNTSFEQSDDAEGVDAAVAEQAAINQAAAVDIFYNAGPANEITAPTGTGTEVVNDDAVTTDYLKQQEESGRE